MYRDVFIGAGKATMRSSRKNGQQPSDSQSIRVNNDKRRALKDIFFGAFRRKVSENTHSEKFPSCGKTQDEAIADSAGSPKSCSLKSRLTAKEDNSFHAEAELKESSVPSSSTTLLETPSTATESEKPDEFQKQASPQPQPDRRNFVEKGIGWSAKRILDNHSPVGKKEIDQHNATIEESTKDLRAGNKAVKELQKTCKTLQKNIEKNDKKQSKLKLRCRDVRIATSGAEVKQLKKERQALVSQLKEAEKRINESTTQTRSLGTKIDTEKKALAQRKQQKEAFNKQIVTLALNLRRIYQNKGSYEKITVPQFNIPVGNDFIDLKEATFQLVNINTRQGSDGQPLVEITLGDISTQLTAPIDGSDPVDLDVDIDKIKLTLGGPIAIAFHNYLTGKPATVGANLAKMVGTVKKVIQGKMAEAPVHFGVEIGKVSVNADSMNADMIARITAMGIRTPSELPHKMIFSSHLRPSIKVDEVTLKTGRKVEEGSEALVNGDAVKVSVNLKGLDIGLLTNAPEKTEADSRPDQLVVKAEYVGAEVSSPIGLANSTARKLLPSDPLQALAEPLARPDEPGVLERVPGSFCTHVGLRVDDLKVTLGEDVGKRTTMVSPDSPGGIVEGDAVFSVFANAVKIDTKGDIAIDASLKQVELESGVHEHGEKLTLSMAPKGEENAAEIRVDCNPDLVKSLGKALGSDALEKLLVTGDGKIVVKDNVKVTLDPHNKTVSTHVDKVVTNAPVILLQGADMQVRLPESIEGTARDINTTSTLEKNDVSQRSEVRAGFIVIKGAGNILLEHGASGRNDIDKTTTIPVRGKSKLKNLRIENIQSMSSEGKVTRQRTVIHPGSVALHGVEIKAMKVEKAELTLNDELNGAIDVKGVNFRLNDLLSPKEEGQSSALPHSLPRSLRWLLKDKKFMFNGRIPVSGGQIDIRKMATSSLRVKPDSPRASTKNRLTCWLLNTAFKTGLRVMRGKITRFDKKPNRLVLRIPFLRDIPIPLPYAVTEHISAGGRVNLAAAQYRATGLYCLPRSRQQQLDKTLKQALDFDTDSSANNLNALLDEVSNTIKDPSTEQEAFYLLNGLPIEQLTAMAIDNNNICEALKRTVDLSFDHPNSRSVAIEIFNRGGREPNKEQLYVLLSSNDRDAADIALLLHKIDPTNAESLTLLKNIVKKEAGNVPALLKLAAIEWANEQYSEAMNHVRDAAIAANSGEQQEVMTLLTSWGEGEDGLLPVMEARLLAASLAVRREVVEGDGESLLQGIKALESLALIEDESGIGEGARKLLESRCQQAWQVWEELELEDWKAWSGKVALAIKNLQEGKSVELNADEHYLAALGLMYGYKGIDVNLPQARLMFQSLNPVSKRDRVHLDLLDKLSPKQPSAGREPRG